MAWISVQGEVSRLHGSGNGFGLKESWQAQGKDPARYGKDRARYWAVFPKEAVQVSEGDRVKVSGGLQTSTTDPKPDSQGEMRVYVDHVVGQAQVEVVEARGGGFNGGSPQGVPQQSNVASNAPQGGGQGFGGIDENQAPF